MRYFTKDWYLKCQIFPMTSAQRKETADPVNAYQADADMLAVPLALRRAFLFHDGHVSAMETGEDCTIVLDSPYSAHHRIRFHDAVIRQPLPPPGADWLYEELYRHKSGIGYEVHILFYKMGMPRHKTILASDLFETKIICREISLL